MISITIKLGQPGAHVRNDSRRTLGKQTLHKQVVRDSVFVSTEKKTHTSTEIDETKSAFVLGLLFYRPAGFPDVVFFFLSLHRCFHYPSPDWISGCRIGCGTRRGAWPVLGGRPWPGAAPVRPPSWAAATRTLLWPAPHDQPTTVKHKPKHKKNKQNEKRTKS